MLLALAGRRRDRERREDLRFGVVAAATLNATRSSKHKPEPWKPADFFPQAFNRAEAAARVRSVGDDMVASGHATRMTLTREQTAEVWAIARRQAAEAAKTRR